MFQEQGESVERVENNVEAAHANVTEGEKMLCQAVKYKQGMYPLLGALLGSVLGGPVGLLAGMKLGSLTAVACGFLGINFSFSPFYLHSTFLFTTFTPSLFLLSFGCSPTEIILFFRLHWWEDLEDSKRNHHNSGGSKQAKYDYLNNFNV